MICSFCGAVVLRGATFCTQCGAPQPKAAEQQGASRGSALRDFEHRGVPRDAVLVDEEVRDQVMAFPQEQQQRYLVVPLQASIRWEAVQPSAAPVYAPVPRVQVPSYRKRATVAFFLYFAFFFPGLIASFVWWRQANDFDRRTGITPPGKRALTVLLGFGILVLSLWMLSAIG